MTFRPIISQNSHRQNIGQINDMIRDLNREQTTKTYKGSDGEPAVIIGKLPSGEYGIRFTDGTVTTTITAASFVQNDGTNDRLFMGNEE